MTTINPFLLPNTLNDLYALHETLTNHLAAVDAAIWEIEEGEGNVEEREWRSDYLASIL